LIYKFRNVPIADNSKRFNSLVDNAFPQAAPIPVPVKTVSLVEKPENQEFTLLIKLVVMLIILNFLMLAWILVKIKRLHVDKNG